MIPSNCPICGSSEFELLEETDLRNHYHCKACDHDFFALNKRVISHNTEELNAEEVFKKNIDSVVIIEACNGAKMCQGSGFFIDEHHVITNAHVALAKTKKLESKAYHMMKFYKSKESFPLTIKGYDVDKDLAILYSAEPLENHVTFAKRELQVGEACFAIGNSRGQGLAMTQGIISDPHRVINGVDYVLSSAITTKGNSGGPLFDKYGELIGVNSSSYVDSVAMNFAIDLKTLETFINHKI